MKNQWDLQKEIFAKGLFQGLTPCEAYLSAFPEEKKISKKALTARAYRFARRPEIKARVRELEEEAKRNTVVTLEQFIIELQTIALNKVDLSRMKVLDKLRALELLAKVLNFSSVAAEQQNDVPTTLELMVKELYEWPDEKTETVHD